MYLIDTDIIIYGMKGHEAVRASFLLNETVPKAISVITYGELLFGADKSKNPEHNRAAVYRVRELFPVIEIDTAIIETFAGLKAALQKSGKTLDDMDLLIAATALTMNATLVTNNDRHFSRVKGLKMENWTLT